MTIVGQPLFLQHSPGQTEHHSGLGTLEIAVPGDLGAGPQDHCTGAFPIQQEPSQTWSLQDTPATVCFPRKAGRNQTPHTRNTEPQPAHTLPSINPSHSPGNSLTKVRELLPLYSLPKDKGQLESLRISFSWALPRREAEPPSFLPSGESSLTPSCSDLITLCQA